MAKVEPSFIDSKLMNKSLSNYENNTFVIWLSKIIGDEAVAQAISRYSLGTSKEGGACFWQIDLQGKIRTGKIIQYDTTGHRRKDVMLPVQWVHSILKLPNYELSQCLFGEHLLRDTTKKIAIVESEKTAIIASVYFPDIIWLAAGNACGLGAKGNIDKCKCLKGRTVVLYPDLSLTDKTGKTVFDKWSEKAKELSAICTVSVSDTLEKIATEQEREDGFDLADYLIKTPFAVKIKPQPVQTPQPENKQRLDEVVQEGPVNIDAEIAELEALLKNRIYPSHPIKLDGCTTVMNAQMFVEWGLHFLKNNQRRIQNGFIPTLHRLWGFEQITRN
jgi:hypothetical protein